MEKGFNYEIKKLESNDNVENKLMAFALYSNLHDLLIQTLSKYDLNAAKFYSDYLTVAFGRCMNAVALEGKTISCHDFIEKVVKKIDSHDFSNIYTMRDLLEYQRNNVADVESCMTYVDVIDSVNIDFEAKAELVTATRNHVNAVYNKISSHYDENESHNFFSSIVMELVESMPSILEVTTEAETFKWYLKEKTAEIIIKKVSANEFDLNNFKSIEHKEFIASLDESEQKNYMYGFNYFLAGYESGDEPLSKGGIIKMLQIPNGG